MANSIKVSHKRRGRPATGKDPHVAARMPQPLIDEIDRWARRSDVVRSEAIRRLVELGLKAKREAKPVSKSSRRQRAQELATKAIEKMIDPAASPKERVQRRRRLTKGPPEFREDRVDLPKPKS